MIQHVQARANGVREREDIVVSFYGPAGGRHGHHAMTLDNATLLLANLAVAIGNIKGVKVDEGLLANALLQRQFGGAAA